MNNVPPSVRAALKRRGADQILNQEGEYINFKPQIDKIIHAGEDMSGYIGDTESFEDYDDDAKEDISPEEKKAEKAIEGYADKYGTGSDDVDARPNETKLRDMNLSDSEMWNMAYQYIGTDKLEKLAEQLDLESPQDIPTNELLKYMSDSDIEDMIRVNGLDDFNDEFYDNDELFDSEYELITEKGEEESKKFREREGVKDVSKLTNEEFNNLARKAMEEYGIKDFALAQEFVVGNESNVLGSEEGHNPDDFKTEFPDDKQKEPHVKGPDGARYDNPDDYYNSKRIKEEDLPMLSNKERLAPGGLAGIMERKGHDVSDITDKSMVVDGKYKIVDIGGAGFDVYDGDKLIAHDIGGHKDFSALIDKYESESKPKNWYDNLSDDNEHARLYKEDAMKVNPERAALIAAAMDEYIAEKPERGVITYDQLKKYGERLGLPQMSDRDLRLMWNDVHNVAGYRGFGTPYDKGGRELEDAQSAFAEVVNQEARNRKAKGNYFPYNDEDIQGAKNKILDIIRPHEGYDLDSAEAYMTGRELMQIEDIADKYHISDEDLKKLHPMLNPDGMGYRVKGWISPEAIKKEKENEDNKLRDYLSKSDLGLSKDLIDELVKYVRDKKDN